MHGYLDPYTITSISIKFVEWTIQYSCGLKHILLTVIYSYNMQSFGQELPGTFFSFHKTYQTCFLRLWNTHACWIEKSCVERHHASCIYVSYPRYLYMRWLGEIPRHLFSFFCFFLFFFLFSPFFGFVLAFFLLFLNLFFVLFVCLFFLLLN